MAPGMTKPSTPTSAEKALLRREALGRRMDEPGPVEASHKAKDHGLRLLAGQPRGIVSGYLAVRDELNPQPLMQALAAAGHQLSLPVIETKWSPLTFRAFAPGDRLVDAGFGLKEPMRSAAAVLPNILLVPVAAFDAEGFRIGYGGGYYDRTLALFRSERPVLAVGIAYDCQEVPAFTHEAHDQRLDYLVTPAGVRKFGP